MTFDILIPAAFLAGLFGSGHCLGMCGPVVVLLESQQTSTEKFRGVLRRVIYNTGRLFFYLLLGAVAGALGIVLTKITGVKAGLSILRILAGVLVMAIGLNLMFNLRALSHLESAGTILWRRLSPLARHVLPVSTPGRALAAGFIWGALPCGLVYSSVAMAATTGSLLGGMTIMLVFWLGTMPTLMLAGASAKKLGEWTKHPTIRRITGVLLVGIGAFALLMPYLHGRMG